MSYLTSAKKYINTDKLRGYTNGRNIDFHDGKPHYDPEHDSFRGGTSRVLDTDEVCHFGRKYEMRMGYPQRCIAGASDNNIYVPAYNHDPHGVHYKFALK